MKSTFFKWVGLSLGLLLPSLAYGGGPFGVSESGFALKWSNQQAVLMPEGGDCGPKSNAEMISLIRDQVLDVWNTIGGATFSLTLNEGTIEEDLNENNFTTFYVLTSGDFEQINDAINPLIFDDNGAIIAALYGEGNDNILGAAVPTATLIEDPTKFADGQMIINCKCLEDSGNDCEVVSNGHIITISVTDADLIFTIIHEVGHFLGLDHSQAAQEFIPLSGEDFNCNPATADCAFVPTMFPQAVDSAEQKVLSHDDEVAFLNLYGDTGWQDSYCSAEGILLDRVGKYLRCADVEAINEDDPTETVSVISGGLATYQDLNDDDHSNGDGECLSRCGDFTLNGLRVGVTYSIWVKPVSARWNGSSGINPCYTNPLSTVEEEKIKTVNCDVAGKDIPLGTITTGSSGGIEEGTPSGGGGGSGLASSGCNLNHESSSLVSHGLYFFILAIFPSFLILRFKKIRNVLPHPKKHFHCKAHSHL